MGKKNGKGGWRSIVQEGDTLGDHFQDISAEDARTPINLNDLTIDQVRDLQKKYCRKAGTVAGARAKNEIARAHQRAGHGDVEDKEKRQISRLYSNIAKMTRYLDPNKTAECCPDSLARRRDELTQAQERLAAMLSSRDLGG